MDTRSVSLPSAIGRFRIEALLGSGGMGEVYKAFDPTLQRTVAVKTVRPDIDRPEYLARLYREAQACARLQHPNIVTVHEAGEIDGVVYIAMEYLKGEDLAAALRRGALSFEEKIRVLIQVLDALQHAHDEDVIHRDVKPSNVQRLPDGSVKLVDFGVARVMRAETMTATSAIIGTPNYASPEQLKGQSVDRRTDIYSTGALAYEMCTGRRPFQGDGEGLATVILKVISEPLPPMNVSWSRRFPEIERIVSRAMSKSADDRYQSAAEMRTALAAFLAASRDAILAAQSDVTTELGAGAVDTGVATRSMATTLPASGEIRLKPDPTYETGNTTARESQTTHDRDNGTRRQSRTAWWLGGAAAAAILVAAGVAISRTPAAATNTRESDVQLQPAPLTASSSAPGDTRPSADSVPAAIAPAVLTATALRSSDALAAAMPEHAVADAGAKQLFYGDNGRAGSGRTEGSGGPGGATSPGANAGLRYRLIQQASAGEVDVDPSTTFHSGDRVRFSFESNIDGYLYVVQEGSSGRWTVLFPHVKINSGKNAIQRFEKYQVPSEGWFMFDANPGTEQIFVFLSREPLTQLPGFDQPVTRTETLSAAAVSDLQQRIRPRDLIFEEERSDRVAPGGKASQATYIVNRDEVGKAVAATITLTHGQ